MTINQNVVLLFLNGIKDVVNHLEVLQKCSVVFSNIVSARKFVFCNCGKTRVGHDYVDTVSPR